MNHETAVSNAKDIADRILAPAARQNDKEARFSSEAVAALGPAGLLGIMLPTESGGSALGPRTFATVVATLAEADASAAMVYLMHMCATATLAAARSRFDERHAQIHGHSAKDRPVEIVSYRLRLRVEVPKYVRREEGPLSPSPSGKARKGERKVWFEGAGAALSALYERDELDPGAVIAGPAVVEQLDATTAIPPGWRAVVDGFRHLVLSKGEQVSDRAQTRLS